MKYKVLFDPEQEQKVLHSFEIEDNRLSVDAIKTYGAQITTQRRKIREQALAADETKEGQI
jgi:hypothetical protein